MPPTHPKHTQTHTHTHRGTRDLQVSFSMPPLQFTFSFVVREKPATPKPCRKMPLVTKHRQAPLKTKRAVRLGRPPCVDRVFRL